MFGIDGERALDQLRRRAGKLSPLRHGQRVRIIGEQDCIIRYQRLGARVRIGGLGEAFERLVGMRQQHPPVGIVRILLEALGETFDHRRDLPVRYFVARSAASCRGGDRGDRIAEALVERERRHGYQQQ